jgi:hypothetical protein
MYLEVRNIKLVRNDKGGIIFNLNNVASTNFVGCQIVNDCDNTKNGLPASLEFF